MSVVSPFKVVGAGPCACPVRHVASTEGNHRGLPLHGAVRAATRSNRRAVAGVALHGLVQPPDRDSFGVRGRSPRRPSDPPSSLSLSKRTPTSPRALALHPSPFCRGNPLWLPSAAATWRTGQPQGVAPTRIGSCVRAVEQAGRCRGRPHMDWCVRPRGRTDGPLQGAPYNGLVQPLTMTFSGVQGLSPRRPSDPPSSLSLSKRTPTSPRALALHPGPPIGLGTKLRAPPARGLGIGSGKKKESNPLSIERK